MQVSAFRMIGAGMLVVAAAMGLASCKKAAAPATTAQAAPTTDVPGCDVARAYVAGRLARFADKSVVVVEAAAPSAAIVTALKPADLTRKYNIGEENPAGWPKDAPSAAMVSAWQAAAQTSPFVSCVDFGKVVETAGVAMGRVAPGEKPAKDKPDRTQMNFTVPVVSADGNEAMVLETGRTGSGSQVSIAVHLRKDKAGAWGETDSLVVAMN